MADQFKKFIFENLTLGPIGLREPEGKGDEEKAPKLATQEEAELLTSDESMKVWLAAFTHKSVSPTDNYEFLEIVGDSVLSDCFMDYFDQYREEKSLQGVINEEVMTGLKNHWLAKEQLATFSTEYGFIEFIKFKVGAVKATELKSIREDVFEAFFGAIRNLGRKVLTRGRGYEISFWYLRLILDQQTFELSSEKLKSKVTALKELFQGLYGGTAEPGGFAVYDQDLKEVRWTICDFDNLELASVTAPDLPTAKEKASELALAHLKERGIDPSTVRSAKNKRLEDPEIKAKVAEANEVLKAVNEAGGYNYALLTGIESLRNEPSNRKSGFVIGVYTREVGKKANELTRLSVGTGASWKSAVINALDNFILRRGISLSVNPFNASEHPEKEPEVGESILEPRSYRPEGFRGRGRGAGKGRGRGVSRDVRDVRDVRSQRGAPKRGGPRGRGRGGEDRRSDSANAVSRSEGRPKGESSDSQSDIGSPVSGSRSLTDIKSPRFTGKWTRGGKAERD